MAMREYLRHLAVTVLFLVLAKVEVVAAMVAATMAEVGVVLAGWDLIVAFPAVVVAAMAAYWLVNVYQLPGRCRPLSHVCLEYADRVADWAGWEWLDADGQPISSPVYTDRPES
ncbi:MAG: hypothetical protein JO362_12380 [Streptomycetaceae bacterium]|nr:hypothetical protein [Streptomycetaceae bacterium]